MSLTATSSAGVSTRIAPDALQTASTTASGVVSAPVCERAALVSASVAPGASSTIEVGDRIHKMNGRFAGADFFSMFSFPLLQGGAAGALAEPGVIAISRHMANLFYGSPEQAIGRTLRFENSEDLKVTAVFDDVPARSSLQFDFLRSWPDFVKQNSWVNNWGNSDPETFVQLRATADPTSPISATTSIPGPTT